MVHNIHRDKYMLRYVGMFPHYCTIWNQTKTSRCNLLNKNKIKDQINNIIYMINNTRNIWILRTFNTKTNYKQTNKQQMKTTTTKQQQPQNRTK